MRSAAREILYYAIGILLGSICAGVIVWCVTGCTSLQGGKAATVAGRDTTVVTTDGIRVERNTEHDERSSDQGHAAGVIKTVDLKAGGGEAGVLGNFSGKLTASMGGSWLIGFLLIAAGGAVAYYLKKYVVGIGIMVAGIIVCVYPMNQIIIGVGCLAILGIVFYTFREQLSEVVGGVKEGLQQMPAKKAEEFKTTLGVWQSPSTKTLVKEIADATPVEKPEPEVEKRTIETESTTVKTNP